MTSALVSTIPGQLPSRDRPDDLDDDVEALFASFPTFAAAFDAWVGNLNSLAGGGVFAMPYRFSPTSGPTSLGGWFAFANDGVNAQTSTIVYVDAVDFAGKQQSPSLAAAMTSSTSATRCRLRAVKITDPSKFVIFNIASVANSSSFWQIAVTHVNSSSANPFAYGDALMLFFEPTGDKGETGPVNSFPKMHMQELANPGTPSVAPTFLATGVYRQYINNVRWNAISGASVASSQFTLPTGTYGIESFVKANVATGNPNDVYRHFLALYNVTDGAYALFGPQAQAWDRNGSASYITETAVLNGVFSVSGGAKTYEIRHLTPNAIPSAVSPANVAGTAEIYKSILITKTA